MIVDCAHYRDGRRQHEHVMSIAEAAACRTGERSDFVWVGLHEPSNEEMEEVAGQFGLHELAVEDAERAHQRPKIEDYDDSFFLVLKTAHYHDESETVHFGEIDVFAGPGYMVSVRHGEGTALGGARRRLEERPDLLKSGPAAVSGRSSTRSSTITCPSPRASTTTSRRSSRQSSTTTSQRRPSGSTS